MTLASAIAYYEENEPRGEYVLVLEGADRAQLEEEKRKSLRCTPRRGFRARKP